MSTILELSPPDEHNRTLVENVHTPDWQNPSPAPMYNLVVIGGGTAGLVAAAGAAELGARVALIERHLLGGDCLNFGCVPSKTIIRSARVLGELRRAEQFGIFVPQESRVDFARIMERMRRVRAGISGTIPRSSSPTEASTYFWAREASPVSIQSRSPTRRSTSRKL